MKRAAKPRQRASGERRQKEEHHEKYFALIAVAALIAVFVRSARPGHRLNNNKSGKPPPTPETCGSSLNECRAGRAPPPGDFLFMSTEMAVGGKVVRDAPYSAQAVSESTQTLSDGNRIVSKSTSAVYRDSEGRTRREQTLRAIGPFCNWRRRTANDLH